MTFRGSRRAGSFVALSVAAGVVALTGFSGCRRHPSARPHSAHPAEAPMSAAAQAGQRIFDRTCVGCHSVGQGRRVGPDLVGVQTRRDHGWLVRWMQNPMEMGRTDPVGQQLVRENNNVPMPNPNLNPQEIDQVLAYVQERSAIAGGHAAPVTPPVVLAEADFQHARRIYFDRCAGCHGTMRAGATGPNIQPTRTRQIGTEGIRAILHNGTPGGMPAWGRAGILDDTEIGLMANFVQMPPPVAPQRPMEEIRTSWNLSVPVAQRPTRVMTRRNWENYFGVILRDAGQVAIIDGDTFERVALINTGFAVHILRSSSTGRYFYAVGRDGRVTLIDLWPEVPNIVSQVQGCFDARSVESSRAHGFEDRLVIEGCYWPPQYVIYDGLTLEPRHVQPVPMETFDTHERLQEVRVASIVASHSRPQWVVSLKESGNIALVDYSQPNFPITSLIGAERFLHDGGWDHTGRYFMVAANMRNRMAVVDTLEQRLTTVFDVGIRPHPGRGANWEDPQYGWVNATGHIGEGRLVVYGADPQRHPEHAWRIVRNITLTATGSLFVKTHPNSPWVWIDSTLSNDANGARQICVYSKAQGTIHRCWQVSDHGRGVHFEYNRAGTQMWVSVWDRQGELVVYNDRDLTEVRRIREPWLVTPTGKFNVYNTAHDIY